MNDARIARRRKPIARRTAISRPREATAAYMVFITAKAAPIAMKIAMNLPISAIGLPFSVCFRK